MQKQIAKMKSMRKTGQGASGLQKGQLWEKVNDQQPKVMVNYYDDISKMT